MASFIVTKTSNGYILKDEAKGNVTVHMSAASVCEEMAKSNILQMDVINGSININISVSNIFNADKLK